MTKKDKILSLLKRVAAIIAQPNTRNIAVKYKFNLSASYRHIRKGELLSNAFLTSTLDGNEQSISNPSRFIPGKNQVIYI